MEEYDLIIVGAGPAGLAAAIYAARYHLKILVIGGEPGGYVASIKEVHNFPSYLAVSGFELMQKIISQVNSLGVSVIASKVVEIRRDKEDKVTFIVKTDLGKEYSTKTIILATGREKKKLGIKGEEEFFGRGVSYCATCDAPLYKNKIVCVVGGGNSAMYAALLSAEHASKVYLIYRKEELSAQPELIKQTKNNKKIEILLNENIIEIVGDKVVSGIKLKSGKKIELGGVFIEIGSIPNLTVIKSLKIKSRESYILVDKNQKTNLKGFFAAGDITENELKQIVTAVSQGAVAAFSAYNFVREAREK